MAKVVLVDAIDNVIGEKEVKAAHRHPVPLHRAVSIVLYNEKGEMLITKRSSEKFTWPDFWSNAVCTNVRIGESYVDCANRRLKQELGVEASLEEKLVFTYEAKYDDEFGEHELDHTFVGTYSGELKPDPIEIADYKWIAVDELKQDVHDNPEKYTPWFKVILGRLSG